MPGTGPTQGRSPSFTNLKPIKDRSSTGGAGSVTSGGGSSQPKQSGMQRERSFVEPNFVETFKPPQVQIMSASTCFPNTNLMGSPGHAAQKMSERLEEKVAVLQVHNKSCNNIFNQKSLILLGLVIRETREI